MKWILKHLKYDVHTRVMSLIRHKGHVTTTIQGSCHWPVQHRPQGHVVDMSQGSCNWYNTGVMSLIRTMCISVVHWQACCRERTHSEGGDVPCYRRHAATVDTSTKKQHLHQCMFSHNYLSVSYCYHCLSVSYCYHCLSVSYCYHCLSVS